MSEVPPIGGHAGLVVGRLLRRQMRQQGLHDDSLPQSLTQWHGLLERIARTYDEFDQLQKLAQHADRLASLELEQARALLERERDALVTVVRDRGNELQQVRELTGIGSFRLNIETQMMTISESLASVLGFAPGALALSVKEFLEFILPADRERFRLAFIAGAQSARVEELDVSAQSRSGDVIYLSCRLHSATEPNGRLQRIHGAVINVTEQHLSSFKIRHLAFFDELTGLPNRTHFLHELARAADHTATGSADFAVFFVDLDGFKEINDTLGHDAGDELLRVISGRLRSLLRTDDMVARIGGDEFVLLLPGLAQVERAGELADQILRNVALPLTVDGCDVRVSASIGMSFYPQDATTAKDLLKQADMAMYLAKRRGRNRWTAYDAKLAASGRTRLQTIKDIRDALERDEFEPYFQPIVDGAKSTILGVEALVRWNHPTRGLLAPVAFLDLAEHYGLVDQIGEIMLYRSLRQMQKWREAGATRMYVSVNVSPSQLTNPALLESIKEALQLYCIPAELLQLEITESSVMRDPVKGLEALHALSALGVRLALDDFGTGYSALSTLQDYPIHTIKLDRSFVANIKSETQAAPLVSAVAAIAASLGLELIAEGVETAEQRQRLLDYGYTGMQGYWFFKPMIAADLSLLLGLIRRPETSEANATSNEKLDAQFDAQLESQAPVSMPSMERI